MTTEATNFLNFRDEGCAYIDRQDQYGRMNMDRDEVYQELAKKVRGTIG